MEERNELWKGGSWEHPEEAFPAIPPVVIPDKPMEPRKKKHKRRWKLHWFPTLVLAVFVLALSAAALKGTLFPDPPPKGDYTPDEYINESTEPPDIDRVEEAVELRLELEGEDGQDPLTQSRLYAQTAPSIVAVESLLSDSQVGAGTGVILSEDGFILTNAHVVAGGIDVVVILSDNSYHPARLVGFQYDEDLAVLKIDAEGLTPASFGDSADLRPGDPVAAIGNPMGYRGTITGGIISGVDRSVEGSRGGEMIMLQTDAPLNHGNSGGALINRYGQVVGINTIKLVRGDGSSEAMGFAIPSRRVKYVANRLMAGEPVETAVFGFTVKTIPVEGGGLELIEVSEASDCWDKGLRAGDVVLTARGRRVNSSEDLASVKLDLGPGDTLELTYRRDGGVHTAEVALISRDDVK